MPKQHRQERLWLVRKEINCVGCGSETAFLKATFSPNPVILSQTSFPFNSLHLTLGICPIPCEPSYSFLVLPHLPQLQVAGNSFPNTGVYRRPRPSPHSALWLRVEWHMRVRVCTYPHKTRMHTRTHTHASMHTRMHKT